MNEEKVLKVEESEKTQNFQLDDHVHGPGCNHHHHHEVIKPVVRQAPKISRNDPCICGSNKKYKKCCGA